MGFGFGLRANNLYVWGLEPRVHGKRAHAGMQSKATHAVFQGCSRLVTILNAENP